MHSAKSVGIWMDHSKAHIMEFTTVIKTVYIESEFTHEDKNLAKGEKMTTNQEHAFVKNHFSRH